MFRRTAVSVCVEYTLSIEEFMSFTSCSRSTSSSADAGGQQDEQRENEMSDRDVLHLQAADSHQNHPSVV